MPGGQKVSDDVIEAVLAASRGLVAMVARSVESTAPEVTVPQLRVVAILATNGPETLTALAADLSSSPPSTSRLCDRLEQKGLIVRKPGANSRREISVELTDAGAELYHQVVEARRREVGAMLAGLSATERRQILDAIQALAALTGEMPGAGPSSAG